MHFVSTVIVSELCKTAVTMSNIEE